jgi:ribosomal protein S12 methylthiotransferase accessory factor
LIRYQSSYRAVSVQQALNLVRPVAARLGISRVTDITHLDRIGMPVFASVRPNATEGSLCVNAGKGLTIGEARIGAYMEAVEFAYAEPAIANIEAQLCRVRDVLDGRKRRNAILDLCPVYGVVIPLDARLECVEAEPLRGAAARIPAELVFFPYEQPRRRAFFGSSTNGLASGSTLVEATVHALLEIIERDIAAFERLGRESFIIEHHSVPRAHRDVIASMRGQGFELVLHWLPNEYDIACIRAILWETGELDPLYITDGYGCHLDPSVALTRALTEAVQSRLTMIHGARDDITECYAKFRGWSRTRKALYAKRVLAGTCHKKERFDFRSVTKNAAGCKSLADVLACLCDALARAGMQQVLRVCMTPRDSRVHVVRIIVPRMESFSPTLPRVGPRLVQFASDA